MSDAKFKVEFRQVEDISGQGQKQTVAFITPADGSADGKSPAKTEPTTNADSGSDLSNSRLQPPPTLPTQPVFDPKLVEDFLAGEYCLNGVGFNYNFIQFLCNK